MKLEEAINASQIQAARGYDDNGQCVVSVAYYGDALMWLKGFGGNWAKNWETITDEDRDDLKLLSFAPSGPKPESQLEQETLEALTAIHEDEDDFEPMGEAHN